MSEELRHHDDSNVDRPFSAVWIVLSVLFLLPVVFTDHLPIQDIPTHLAIIKTLADQDATPGWDEHFEDRLSLRPYVTYYASGVQLARWFGADVANRILLAIYLLLLPLSFLSLVLAVDRSRRWVGVLGFLLVYSDLYLLGFTNYMLSVPMVLFASAVALRLARHDVGGYRLVALLAVLALLIYFTHPFSLAVLLLILATLLCFSIRRWRRLVWVGGALAPAVLILTVWLLREGTQPGFVRFPLGFKLEYLLRTPVMVLENPDNLALYGAVLLSALLVVLAVVNAVRSGSAQRSIRAALKPPNAPVLVGLVAFTILFFAAPSAIGATIWFDLRLAAFVWIFVFLVWGHRVTAGRLGKALTLALCLVSLIGVGRMHRDFSREIDPLFSVLDQMEPGRRVLPIVLDPTSKAIEPFYFRKRVIPFSTPYAHFGSYYHLEKGGESPWMTFWAGLDWIPLGLRNPIHVKMFRLTDPFQPIRLLRILPEVAPQFDYLLVRGSDRGTSAWIERFAVLRSQAGPFFLYEIEGR